jgi:hypothetical protein
MLAHGDTRTWFALAGKDHSGSTQAGVPSLFGMNFQSVSTAEKLTESDSQPGGYGPDGQSPGPVLASALGFVDTQIGRMVEGAHSFLRLPEPPERDARRSLTYVRSLDIRSPTVDDSWAECRHEQGSGCRWHAGTSLDPERDRDEQ